MSLNPESDWARKKAFADLQVVSDETAVGTFYLLQRQLESLGCVGVGREPPERFGTSPIRIYAYTSDGGSDQSKFKKLCGCLLEDDDSTLFMAFSCYMHCCQLIMKTGSNLTDSWFKRHVDPDVGKPFKYFATIAKLSYTWRDCSKPIYKTWVRKLGDVSAITHCKKNHSQMCSGSMGINCWCRAILTSTESDEHYPCHSGCIRFQSGWSSCFSFDCWWWDLLYLREWRWLY